MEEEITTLRNEISLVREELKSKEKEKEEYKELLLRMKAEFENYRKRVNKEIVEVKKSAIANFVRDLLSVLDNFERAISSFEKQKDVSDELRNFIEGMKMVYYEMKNIFKKYDIEEYAPIGEDFDPRHSEAIAVEDVKEKEKADKILEVFEKGYRMGEKVIRLAKVKVGKHKIEDKKQESDKEKENKKNPEKDNK